MSQHPAQIPFFSFIICSLQRPQTHPSSAGTNHRLKTQTSLSLGGCPPPPMASSQYLGVAPVHSLHTHSTSCNLGATRPGTDPSTLPTPGLGVGPSIPPQALS